MASPFFARRDSVTEANNDVNFFSLKMPSGSAKKGGGELMAKMESLNEKEMLEIKKFFLSRESEKTPKILIWCLVFFSPTFFRFFPSAFRKKSVLKIQSNQQIGTFVFSTNAA